MKRLEMRVLGAFLTAVTKYQQGQFEEGREGSPGSCLRGLQSTVVGKGWQPEAQLVTWPLHPGSREKCMLVLSCRPRSPCSVQEHPLHEKEPSFREGQPSSVKPLEVPLGVFPG